MTTSPIREKKVVKKNTPSTSNHSKKNKNQNKNSVQTMKKIQKSEAEWRKELSPEEYYILREKGTERAFTGKYNDFKGDGVFHCAGCQQALFDSKAKFDSGTGWPSFYKPINKDAISEHSDNSHGMSRTEILCPRCSGHLGHVFPDGPADKGGLRYCINSASLRFQAR